MSYFVWQVGCFLKVGWFSYRVSESRILFGGFAGGGGERKNIATAFGSKVFPLFFSLSVW